jgi:trimeric autotransporter adhesin
MRERWLRNRSLISALVLVVSLSPGNPASGQNQTQATVPQRIIAPIDESSLVTLPGNVHPLAQSRYDVGPVSPSTPTSRLILVLERSTEREAELQTYLQTLQDKNSPNFHKFLSPDEFGRRFGENPADLSEVQQWLALHGFDVTRVARSGMSIEFSGTAGQVENAFHTSLHRYVRNGEEYWANATDPAVPSALAPVIAGIASLTSLRPRAQYIRGPRGIYDAQTHRIRPNYTLGNTTSGYYIFLGPADAATIYNTPTTLNANVSGTTYDGTGVTIGVAGDSNIDLTQNANYRSTFGLAVNPTTVVVDGNDPGENGDAIEAYLDTQVAGALAPKANVILYTAADTTYQPGVILAIQRALDDNQADILNVSFSNCEANLESSGNLFLNDLWEQAAAQGIAVTVAAGDSGSAGCDDPDTETEAINGLAVNGLASTPFNVAVGGTDFDVLYSAFPTSFTEYVDVTNSLPDHRSALNYIPEEPWNNSTLVNTDIASNETEEQYMNIEAGGGGISNVYGLPPWQASTGSGVGRNLPDVSFLAGNGFYGATWGICTDQEVDSSGNSVADCAAGAAGNDFNLTGVGGTSAAAPAFAGMLALVQQKTGSRLGQADYVLYDLGGTSYASVFHDVATGDNSVFCQLNSPDCQVISASTYEYYLSGYNATGGYDTASGLGSVNASQMEASWSGPSFSATNSAFTLDGATTPLTITHGQSVAVSDSVTSAGGNPGGVVELVDTLSPATRPNAEGIAAFTLTNGGAAGTTNSLPGGNYQVSAHYSGSNTFAASDSNAIAVTVNPESSSTTLTITGIFDPATGKAATTPYYGFIYLLDAQPYGNSASASHPNGAATGTVTFKDGTATLGTATLSSEGVAELQTSSIAGGSSNLTAVFPGDASFLQSTSAGLAYSITPAVTTLKAPSQSPFDPYVGANETLTASLTVDSAGAAPSGSVTFMNGSTAVGTAPMNGTSGSLSAPAAGTASLTVNTLPSGTDTITAIYSGDGNYAGTTSPATQIQILLNPTTLGFSPTNQSVKVNQPLQFTVTPAPITGLPVPTGTVTVYYYNSGVNVLANLVNGTAAITIPANTQPLGPVSLYVSYSGDTVYAPTTGSYTATILSAGTVAPQLNLVTPSSITGLPVVITVSVSGPSGDPGPTGSITLTGSPAYLIAVQPLVNGTATFNLNAGFAYGVNSLTATYLGDTTYAGGTATATLNFPAGAAISFNSATTTLDVDQAYTVAVSVATVSPFPAPTGNITLTSGNYTSGPVQLISGTASITVPANSLAIGTDTITASYSGDTNYVPGSNTESVIVTSAPPGLAVSGASLTVAPGASSGNTATITVTPSNGFTGTVTLTASLASSPSGAQDLPTLSFGTTNPVSITGAAAGTATLTVSTTAPSSSAALAPLRRHGWQRGGETVLACLLICGFFVRRRGWRGFLVAGFLLSATLIAGITGCGGSGGSGGGGQGNPGTTPGTYTVMITATSGSLTANTTLNLTVQ